MPEKSYIRSGGVHYSYTPLVRPHNQELGVWGVYEYQIKWYRNAPPSLNLANRVLTTLRVR